MNVRARAAVPVAAKLRAIREELRIVDLIHDSGQSSGYRMEKCVAEAAAVLAGAKADPEAIEAALRKVRRVWDARFYIPELDA